MSGNGIKPLLKRLTKLARSSEESMQCVERYALLIREPDGDIKFLYDSLVMLQGLAAQTILSDKFTNLSPEEKDLEQRVLKAVMELCDFLLNPVQQNATGTDKMMESTKHLGNIDNGKRRRPEGAPA